jgi:hypothetical protein
MSDSQADVDPEADVEPEPEEAPQLSPDEVSEEVTRLIEAAAQSGLPAGEVAEILAERAEACEYLYEGMLRYGDFSER